MQLPVLSMLCPIPTAVGYFRDTRAIPARSALASGHHDDDLAIMSGLCASIASNLLALDEARPVPWPQSNLNKIKAD